MNDARDTVPSSMEELRPWLRDMRDELSQNTAATKRIEQNTAEIVAAFQAAQGFWKTVGWVGDAGAKLAKACAVCVLAAGGVWLWAKGFFIQNPPGP